MSHYIMIRRLRGPAILLLLGGVALLDQTGVIHHFWGWFIPLLLIMLGIFMLAERVAIRRVSVAASPIPAPIQEVRRLQRPRIRPMYQLARRSSRRTPREENHEHHTSEYAPKYASRRERTSSVSAL